MREGTTQLRANIINSVHLVMSWCAAGIDWNRLLRRQGGRFAGQDYTGLVLAHRGLICIALALTTSACAGPSGALTEAAFSPNQASAAYRLAPGDKVKVNVFNEPDFSGEFQVNDSGSVAFPLVGEVPAAGASLAEFKARLVSRLGAGFVRNPKVSVEVSSYRPVNVLGEVRSAGQFPFRPGLTVQDAVAMAGGYTYRASTHTVYIRRAAASGEIEVRTDRDPVEVKAGDTVRVPQRFF